MNDEIKEILDNIDIWYKENDLDYSRWFGLEELKQLKDYITNLQYKYENQIHRYNNQKNIITNLQKENERLNTELNAYKDEFCKDAIKKYELVMEQEDYKLRCEKATEFIEKSRVKATPFFKQFDGDLIMPKREVDKLLIILNGGDE